MDTNPLSVPQNGSELLFALFPALAQYGPVESAAQNFGFRKREFISSSEDIMAALDAVPLLSPTYQSTLSQALYHSSKRYPLSGKQISVVEAMRGALQKDSPATFWLNEMINSSIKENYRARQAAAKAPAPLAVSVHPEANFLSNRVTPAASAFGGSGVQSRFVRTNRATV